MANLITEKQKRAIKVEYFTRLFAISLIVPISLLGLFLLAYVIPYYISVNIKDAQVAEQFKSVLNAENKENVGQKVDQTVSQTLEEMTTFEFYNQNDLTPSIYITKIISSQNDNISLTGLSFRLLKKGQGQFVVSGVARSRDGLVGFVEDLKSQTGFVNVDLPVSGLAQDRNISFTLNITITI